MSSTFCEHEIEVEDLAIGLLDGEDAAFARRHLESCACCQEAHARFVEERAIFAERAAAGAQVIPAPLAEPELVESVVAIAASQDRARVGRVVRFARTAFVFAACAAAVVLSVWMHEHTAGSSVADGSSAAPATTASQEEVAASLSSDDQMACAFPMSGSFAFQQSAAASSEVDSPRSAGEDHATCEAPLSSSGSSMLSWRVTSSYATP